MVQAKWLRLGAATFLSVGMLAACGSEEPDVEQDTNIEEEEDSGTTEPAEGDTPGGGNDGETNVDVDTDSGSGSDSESDSDTNTETETDTESETDDTSSTEEDAES